MLARFKNEGRKVFDELTNMKDEVKSMQMGSNCVVSSAASTGNGLGSDTFARPPLLGSNWKDTVPPRKIDVEGQVDRSLVSMMTE